MLVVCGLDKFRAPRPRDMRAAQTHAFGFKMHPRRSPTQCLPVKKSLLKGKFCVFYTDALI